MRRPPSRNPAQDDLPAIDLVGALTMKTPAEVAASPALREAVSLAMRDPAVLGSLRRMAQRLARELKR
jgi:hypothetical protein